ncbi:MAG: xanthine dehydrogenase family protein molybdopterin-binding subunit [Deltaproteobacteria bacterium]
MSDEEVKFRVIGTRPIRHDGIDKVTGRALYGADYSLPGMLHGRVLRSPHAHARILGIDTSAAEALPGVHAVLVGSDLPAAEDRTQAMGEGTSNARHLSDNILAKDKVLYDGHALAAVAASSPAIAEDALALIEVRYEELPPVLTVGAALAPGAEILHGELRTKGIEGDSGPTNLASVIEFSGGDLDAGFQAASVIVEREFNTAMVHQGYIEPHNALAKVDADGQTTLWCSTQGSFDIRQLCTKLLRMPLSQLKVIPTEIGGGFGGKTTIYLEPLAILLARRTGLPVKMVMSRNEVLRATGPTSGSVIRLRMGADAEGRIVAVDARLDYEAGAFPGSPVLMGAVVLFAPYALANFRIVGRDIVVNRPRTAAYRAPGGTNAAFASETLIDELAGKLGLDPVEMRLRNAAKEGTAAPWGPRMKRIGYVELLESVRDHEHYASPLGTAEAKRLRGRGFASGGWGNAGLQSSAILSLNGDGTATLVTGSPDIGGSRTSCAMIAAEELGLEAHQVRPSVADTDSIGHTDVTGGSRVTMATGLAVYEAAQDIKRQLRERAAKMWETPESEIRFQEGSAVREDGEKLTLAAISRKAGHTGGPIVGRATVNANRANGPSFAGFLCDIELDPETGKVEILRATVFQDAGRAIHPAYVEGQMQGGSAQGIGWALGEEYVYDEKGRLANASFLDYRIPTALDLPMIESVILEVPNPAHPLGIRGVGEASIVPPPAAIANALAAATGMRFTTLPLSPPRVFATLEESKG